MAQESNIWIWSYTKTIDFMNKVFSISKYISERAESLRLHPAKKQSQKTHHQKLCAKRAQTVL